MSEQLNDDQIQTSFAGVPRAATSPDDAGQDDQPTTDPPGGPDNVPGAIDDSPPAPTSDPPGGPDGVPGAIDDAPTTDQGGPDGVPRAIDDAQPPPPDDAVQE